MPLAQHFEDLRVWQAARALTKAVYEQCAVGPLKRDAGLRGQLQRAVVSVMSNIAEGFERRSKKEFAQFLGISMASLAETKSLLYVAGDLGYINDTTTDTLLRSCGDLRNMLGALLKSLRARIAE